MERKDNLVAARASPPFFMRVSSPVNSPLAENICVPHALVDCNSSSLEQRNQSPVELSAVHFIVASELDWAGEVLADALPLTPHHEMLLYLFRVSTLISAAQSDNLQPQGGLVCSGLWLSCSKVLMSGWLAICNYVRAQSSPKYHKVLWCPTLLMPLKLGSLALSKLRGSQPKLVLVPDFCTGPCSWLASSPIAPVLFSPLSPGALETL